MHQILALCNHFVLGIYKIGLNQGNWLPIVQFVVLPTRQVQHQVYIFENT
jgi:hypothetical protein